MPAKKSDSGKNSKTDDQYEFDEIDLQVIALLASNPKITHKEIGQAVGLSESRICRRRQKYPKAEWFKLAQIELQALIPDCVKAIRTKLRDGDGTLALAIFRGLGIIVDRQKHDHTGKLEHEHGTDFRTDKLIGQLTAIPPDVLRDIAGAIRACGGQSGPPAPVLGKEIPPDGEGNAT